MTTREKRPHVHYDAATDSIRMYPPGGRVVAERWNNEWIAHVDPLSEIPEETIEDALETFADLDDGRQLAAAIDELLYPDE